MTVGRVVRSHAQAVRYVRTLARHTDSDPNRTNHEVATHMSRTFRPPFSRMWQAVAMGALIAAGVMLLVGAASGGLSATAAEASSADSVPGTHRQSDSRAPGELAGALAPLSSPSGTVTVSTGSKRTGANRPPEGRGVIPAPSSSHTTDFDIWPRIVDYGSFWRRASS